MTSPTYVNVVNGDKLLVTLGDGAQPEVFAHPNLINTTRGFTISATTVTDEIADTSNQANPAYTRRTVKATDFKVDGAGMLAFDSLTVWSDWAQSGVPKNAKIVVNPGANAVTYSGAFVCTNFVVTGDRQSASTCTVTLEQASPVVRS